ncbi:MULTISPECIES: UDP-galactopyranose mutase [unclassified Lebetimonas]|uniref:UDP-galactopyranose mutase n=1 Tax=unclassified Lebetimonas TaxID=2648158 RepID=UPI0004653C35|nr:MULTISPECIES: UDP-galactopyranose mutase [unclassified Lebetimonas]
MFDYIIIGAGFAGSVLAERIVNKLNKKVLIIEKRNHIGGNCYDERIENILVHKYGPHLFHTDEKQVWDYLSNFTEWDIYHHKVLAFIDGKKVPIPFNFNALYEVFPIELSCRIEKKLLENYEYNSKVPILKLKQSNDKDLKFLADFVYEKIFVHYTAKQWDKKPEEIDSEVTARVPVFIGKDDRYFNDKYQGIPKEGYTSLFQKMLNHPNIKIMLNTDFKEVIKIDQDTKKIYFLNQEFKGRLIFTGKIDELFDYKFGELPYRSVRMKFETLEKEYYQEVATVNYPNNYDFTRITEFKYIHPVETNKTVILKEYPQKYIKNQNTPYYPIFTKENQEKYNKYLEFSNNFKNIILVGRLAEYKYYDMDDIIKRALEVFEEKVK